MKTKFKTAPAVTLDIAKDQLENLVQSLCSARKACAGGNPRRLVVLDLLMYHLGQLSEVNRLINEARQDMLDEYSKAAGLTDLEALAKKRGHRSVDGLDVVEVLKADLAA